MPAPSMHDGQLPTDVGLVRGLLADQQPRWADLPIAEVASSGTVNAMYRLGEHLAVRLPRRVAVAKLIEHEQRWLPQLAPLLPIAVPAPVREQTRATSVSGWLLSHHNRTKGAFP